MKLVRVRRTGTPCLVFDPHLDRGFDVASDSECSVTEQVACELIAAGGWELLDVPEAPAPVDAPKPPKSSKKER